MFQRMVTVYVEPSKLLYIMFQGPSSVKTDERPTEIIRRYSWRLSDITSRGWIHRRQRFNKPSIFQWQLQKCHPETHYANSSAKRHRRQHHAQRTWKVLLTAHWLTACSMMQSGIGASQWNEASIHIHALCGKAAWSHSERLMLQRRGRYAQQADSMEHVNDVSLKKTRTGFLWLSHQINSFTAFLQYCTFLLRFSFYCTPLHIWHDMYTIEVLDICTVKQVLTR